MKHENINRQFGVGLEIREQKYTNFEWHPDAEAYPDIARASFELVTTSMPDNAAQTFKDDVGKVGFSERYFRVDRERKVLVVTGSNFIQEKSTGRDGMGYNEEPLDEPHGEWQWHKNREIDDLQFVLNADNTVLRETNYLASIVVSSGDWSKNVKFNLVMASQKKLLGSKIAPAQPDLVDAKLDEIKTLFTAEDDMYRSPIDKSKRIIETSTKFNQVTAIDTPQERFGANVTITTKWQITKDDVVGYVAAPDQDSWRPAYMPPRFQVKNPASGDGAALMISKYSSVQFIREEDGYKAMQKLTISGDFWEPFELQNYPFDIQPLGVVLESTASQLNNIVFKCSCKDLPVLRDTEWSGKGTSANVIFAVDEGKKKRGRYTLTIKAVAQRYYSVHMYRVVAVMALFSLASIVAFCGDPEVNALERLGITFTLMLTATAYSLVIAAGLPTLGYLTFLDKYILATFSFIALVGAEITVIDWVAARHSASPDQPLYNAEDAIEFASYVDLGLWFTVHIGLYIYVSRYVLPEERKKVVRKAVKEKKKEDKKKKKGDGEMEEKGKGKAGENYAI